MTRSASAACCASDSAAHSAGSTRVSAKRQCSSMSPSTRTSPRWASVSHRRSAGCCEYSQLKAGDAACALSSLANFDVITSTSRGNSMRCGAFSPNEANLDWANTLCAGQPHVLANDATRSKSTSAASTNNQAVPVTSCCCQSRTCATASSASIGSVRNSMPALTAMRRTGYRSWQPSACIQRIRSAGRAATDNSHSPAPETSAAPPYT